uniref:SET domain-containing protein n=1 Tax=Anopheles dirus TaxID=7168 RepID=A0A182NV42_9DIPT
MSQLPSAGQRSVFIVFYRLWEEKLKYHVEHGGLKADEAFNFITREIGSFFRTFPYQQHFNLCSDVKNNARARDLRTKGNEMFHPKVKRYIEAIKLYNESIACSEKGSEERAIAYANRSMICYEMHRYEDCLENIRLARDSNYPERLAEKLKKREENAKKALEMMKAAETTSQARKDFADEIKLSFDSHENASQIANCLELRKNDEFGRHMVTNRQLNVGDVVMIDTPFVNVLFDDLRCIRCAFCCGERLFTLIPCEGCTVDMYCSEECLSKAYREYHRYECPIIRDLRRITPGFVWTALRTVAKAIASFDHDLEAIKEHLDGLDASKVNAFTMDWNTAASKDAYNTMHVLSTNQNLDRRNVLSSDIFVATLIHLLMIERTELGPMCEANPAMRKLLFDLILHYLKTIRDNAFERFFVKYRTSQRSYINEGNALSCFPLISMLNHSCAPNVFNLPLRDNRSAIVVIRPVRKGEQLFLCYRNDHTMQSRKERQEELWITRGFRCRCEACLHDYPTLIELGDARETYLQTSRIQSALVSKKIFALASEMRCYLNDHDQKYPTYQLCLTQMHYMLCLSKLYGFTCESADYWKYCNP